MSEDLIIHDEFSRLSKSGRLCLVVQELDYCGEHYIIVLMLDEIEFTYAVFGEARKLGEFWMSQGPTEIDRRHNGDELRSNAIELILENSLAN